MTFGLQAKPTEAVFTLRDPTEVQTFLSKLISWGHTPANAWHQKQSCIGWVLDPSTGAHLVNGYLEGSDPHADTGMPSGASLCL